MSLFERVAVVFLRSSRRYNAVWHASTNELVATRGIAAGERVLLKPPKQTARAGVVPTPHPVPDCVREVGEHHLYDVENEPWVVTD